MVDAQDQPSVAGAAVVDNGLHCVEALKFFTRDLPALSLSLLIRCFLAGSCLKLIHLSVLTEGSCREIIVVALWVLVLCFHTMISVIFRIFWISKSACCRTSSLSGGLGTLKRYDATLIFIGAAWNGPWLLCTLVLQSHEVGALRHAVAIYGISTLIAYTGEVYIFYWRWIPVCEDMNHIVDLMIPSQNYGHSKQGSLSCCELVELDELADVERGRVRVCAVCLDEIDQCGKVRKTPCGHFFHEPCLEGWFKQRGCCPLCRADCTTSAKRRGDMLTADL